MGVFRDVTIEWQGEDYTFSPSNRMLRRIESLGVNIATLMHGLAVGPISAPSLSLVVAEFLKAGGAKVDEDDVFAFIMTAREDQITALATSVAEAITPKEPDEKKPEAHAAKSQSTRKVKSRP